MSQTLLVEQKRYTAQEIAGVDEAGRGCLAGPVVAGACILPESYDLPGLGDSKQLTATERERLYKAIKEQSVAWCVGVASAGEIDTVNILQATFLAMGRAVQRLKQAPSFLRIDGNKTIPAHALKLDIPQEYVIKGDGSVPAISAASILAKTFRDKLMVKLDKRYPGYGFVQHMCYGTKKHLAAIQEQGPCRIHRMTFRGVRIEKPAQQQGSLF